MTASYRFMLVASRSNILAEPKEGRRLNALTQQSRVTDRIRVFTLGGESLETAFGANCVAAAGESSVLLVDPLIAPEHARGVEAAVAEAFGLPISHVVLTHHHTDHALGASYFAARGATVIAHSRCAEAMAAEHAGLIAERRRRPELAGLFDDAEAFAPSLLFDRERALQLPGLTALVIHPGPGHTPGDAILYFPRESIAVCGDLVSNGYHVNLEDADPRGLTGGIEALVALGAERYVPGHGRAGGAELLDAQTRYHQTVRAIVSRGVAAGRIREEIVRDLAAEFPHHSLELVLPMVVTRWTEWIAAG